MRETLLRDRLHLPRGEGRVGQEFSLVRSRARRQAREASASILVRAPSKDQRRRHHWDASSRRYCQPAARRPSSSHSASDRPRPPAGWRNEAQARPEADKSAPHQLHRPRRARAEHGGGCPGCRGGCRRRRRRWPMSSTSWWVGRRGTYQRPWPGTPRATEDRGRRSHPMLVELAGGLGLIDDRSGGRLGWARCRLRTGFCGFLEQDRQGHGDRVDAEHAHALERVEDLVACRTAFNAARTWRRTPGSFRCVQAVFGSRSVVGRTSGRVARGL
jgi:hypothetical protein